jgi:hypothetical protein
MIIKGGFLTMGTKRVGAHAQNIVSQASDKIYGKVVVGTTNAADKVATQIVASGAGVDKIKLHATTTTLGGNVGDVIDLWCYEDGFWNCDARLTLTGGDPGSIAVLAN